MTEAATGDEAGFAPRRVEKPWGHEQIWALTDRYCGKILVIEAGKRLSLQYHERKDEWVHVLSGRMRLFLDDDAGQMVVRELGPGDGAHVPVGRRHRYEGIERCEVLEVRGADGGPPFLVRHPDGHEGLIFPGPETSVSHPE